MKRLATIFLSALLLNLLWENLHSFLYSSYMGGQITEFILARASLVDAALITIISLPFVYISSLKNRGWMIIVIGMIVAVLNERYGLSTGRWTYDDLMPIIPIIKTGLTPTLQLGIFGYVAYKISEYKRPRHSSPRKQF